MLISVLGWTLFAALLAVLAALALPVTLRASARSSPHGRVLLQVSLFAGLAPYVTVVDSARPKTPRRTKKKRDKARKGRNEASRAAPHLIRNAPRLLLDWLRQFRFRALDVEGRFGLSDPAYTGELFGMLCPLVYGLPPGERIRIAVTPTFEKPGLEGRLDATLAVVPLTLVPPALRFVWRSFVARAT